MRNLRECKLNSSSIAIKGIRDERGQIWRSQHLDLLLTLCGVLLIGIVLWRNRGDTISTHCCYYGEGCRAVKGRLIVQGVVGVYPETIPALVTQGREHVAHRGVAVRHVGDLHA